jgi:hypothetical protein
MMKTAGIAFGLNYVSHITSARVYDALCVPQSVWDIPQSIVSAASPVCSLVLNIMQVTQSNVAAVLTSTVAATLAGVLRTP